MSLNALTKISATEPELVDLLVAHLQRNYFELRETCCFMKLEICGDKKFKIAWIKTFDHTADLKDFFYDTVMDRACMMFRHGKDHYEILYRGFFYFNLIEVWPDHVTEGRPSFSTENLEKSKMPSRELIEKGFGELTGLMSATPKQSPKLKKAI